MKINFSELKSLPQDSVLIVPVGEDKRLSPLATALDKQAHGALSKALKTGKFAGKRGQYVSVVLPKNIKSDRLILAGFGTAKNLDRHALENLGGGAVPHVNAAGAKSATFVLE